MNQSARPLISTPLKVCQNTEITKQKVINKLLTNIEMDGNLPLMDDDGDKQALHRRRHSRGFSKTIQLKQKSAEQAAATNPKWTPDQLYSHYSQCMKLSQENKINHKNAFELHLIDHMQQFIHKDGSTNFLVAGGTIYAGAKIYASRVDAIGTLLNRLILSLASGGKDDEEEGGKDGDVDGDNLDPTSSKPKQRRKRKHCPVLETQESNLRVVSIPQMCLANLIQRREGRSVDAANCSYLATNQYKPCEDEVGIKYVEESNDNPLRHDHAFEDADQATDENISDESGKRTGNIFSQLSSYIDTADKKRLKNVDSLNSFDFDSKIPSTLEQSRPGVAPENPFAEDLEAAAIDRVDNNGDSVPLAHISDDDDMDTDGFGCTPVDDDDDVPATASISQVVRNEFDETAAVGRDTLQATTSDALDPARLVALQPGEYSFFKSGAMSSYEGPDNWLKMKNAQAAALKKAAELTNMPPPDGPPTKKRRAPLKVGTELDQSKIASPTGKASSQKMTAAKKEQMRDNKRNQLTFEKCEISKADLLRAMQVRVYIRPLELDYADKQFQQIEQDDLTQAINHTNTDFCPPINLHAVDVDDDDHHDDDDDEGLIFAGGDTSVNRADKSEYEDMIEGDHLVEGPRKLDIAAKLNFGNVAKRMDVKKLKEALWKDLREKARKKKETNNIDVEEPLESQQAAMNCGETAESCSSTNGGDNNRTLDYIPERTLTGEDLLFSQTYSSLPDLLNLQMRESLSIPIAFTCLLHLANEKQLEIQSLPSLKDVIIKLPTNKDNLGDSDIKKKKK